VWVLDSFPADRRFRRSLSLEHFRGLYRFQNGLGPIPPASFDIQPGVSTPRLKSSSAFDLLTLGVFPSQNQCQLFSCQSTRAVFYSFSVFQPWESLAYQRSKSGRQWPETPPVFWAPLVSINNGQLAFRVSLLDLYPHDLQPQA